MKQVKTLQGIGQYRTGVTVDVLTDDEVAKLVKDGKAESVKISTGVVQDNNTQVTSGLNEGDRVITSGGDSLRNLAAVTEQKN